MRKIVLCFFVIVFLVGLTNASPAIDGEKKPIENLLPKFEVQPPEYGKMEGRLMEKFNVKCRNGDISSCLMLTGIDYFNVILKKSQIDIGDFEITKTKSEAISPSDEFSRNLNEGSLEEDQLTQLLFDKVSRFIQTRSLKWKITEDAEVVVNSNDEKDGAFKIGLSLRPSKSTEGDARRRKSNVIGLLLAAVASKIGLIKVLALKSFAILAIKTIFASKLALVVALFLGVQKLFSKEKQVTYEVSAYPHHEAYHEHSLGSGGGHDSYGSWSRNFEGNKLPYRAHAP